MQKKAFTLIELLVVIAIIGILAGIVIVSTRSAILKAKDSQVQSAVAQVKSIAEMIMNDTGKYDDLCTGGGNYSDQLRKLEDQIAKAQGGTTATKTCYASETKYCYSAQLVSNRNNYYCVDAFGNVTSTASATACDGTNYDCL